ncbi:MAG: adenylate/guanylate cyclase domain-containing protein [Saprospiraceae bacterium]|nr:adenylate/guanylate cyclase domain-containing protein [Saprospiraceae bacterium]
MNAKRQELTILFCDLLGSTAFTEQLSLEDFMQLMQSYHRCVYQSVASKYGYVAQHLGDGVMAYFGYPTSFKLAPRNAILAGLALLEDIKEISNQSVVEYNLELKIRISIHTGTVVMADLGIGKRKEHLALGGTPNIAARLQGISTANSVVVSATTYALTKDFFEFQHLGKFGLKGITEQMDVYMPAESR